MGDNVFQGGFNALKSHFAHRHEEETMPLSSDTYSTVTRGERGAEGARRTLSRRRNAVRARRQRRRPVVRCVRASPRESRYARSASRTGADPWGIRDHGESRVMRSSRPISTAALAVGGPAVRNMATIGRQSVRAFTLRRLHRRAAGARRDGGDRGHETPI